MAKLLFFPCPLFPVANLTKEFNFFIVDANNVSIRKFAEKKKFKKNLQTSHLKKTVHALSFVENSMKPLPLSASLL